MSNIYQIFKQAILNRQQVNCTYGGFVRQVCPHVLGTKNGKTQVLAYQFGGQSSKGLPPGGEWRCLEVDKVSGASVADGGWHTGPGHSKPQTCVGDIDVEVDY